MKRAAYYDPVTRVRRPSFDFYPDKWMLDKDLSRCTDADQGVWMRVLCVLHDSDEYGVVRWPIEDLARAARTDVDSVRRLLEKGVLGGVEMAGDMGGISQGIYHTFTRKHATQPGKSVEILAPQEGPIFFCRKFVRDEFIRAERGKHGPKSQAGTQATVEMAGDMGGISQGMRYGISPPSTPPLDCAPSPSPSPSPSPEEEKGKKAEKAVARTRAPPRPLCVLKNLGLPQV